MSNQEIFHDIRKKLQDFENKVNISKKLKGLSKEEAVSKHEKYAKSIRHQLDSYKCLIQSGPFQMDTEPHKSQYKQFEMKLAGLERKLYSQKNDTATQEQLFRHRNQPREKVDLNNRELVIRQGDKKQQQGVDALKRMQQNVAGMNMRADEVLTQMDRQIQKLDQVYEELNDTRETLRRAEQHLKNFSRQVYSDRCLVFIIVLIAVTIIVIIGLSIAGKTPKQQSTLVANSTNIGKSYNG